MGAGVEDTMRVHILSRVSGAEFVGRVQATNAILRFVIPGPVALNQDMCVEECVWDPDRKLIRCVRITGQASEPARAKRKRAPLL